METLSRQLSSLDYRRTCTSFSGHNPEFGWNHIHMVIMLLEGGEGDWVINQSINQSILCPFARI